MTKQDYFSYLSAIPPELWCQHALVDGERRCTLGHLGITVKDTPPEALPALAIGMAKLFGVAPLDGEEVPRLASMRVRRPIYAPLADNILIGLSRIARITNAEPGHPKDNILRALEAL